MKTKIELGKSLGDKVHELICKSVWYSVYTSTLPKVDTPIRDSVSDILKEPINNSTRWNIRL
jgi:hypothetical protein